MPDIVAMGGDNNYTEVEGAGMLLDLGDQDYIKDVQEAYIDMVYDVIRTKKRQYMVFHLLQMLPVSSTIQRNSKSLDWKFRRPGMSL